MANVPSERVKRLRERFLTYKPNVDPERAVIYDRVLALSDDLKDEPMIVARAKAFYTFLNERTIYIEDDQLFAGSFGRVPRAFPIYPESVGDDLIPEYRKLTTREIDPFEYDKETQRILEELLPRWHDASLRQKVFPNMSPEEKNLFLMDPVNNIVKGTNVFTLDVPLYGPAGHITPDWQTVLEQGFQGIKARAEKRLERARAEKDQKGIDFLRATIICCDAITNFAGRYAALAEEMAAREKNPGRKKELEQIAKACRQVPGQPPRTFQEALQAVWLTFVGIQMEAFQRCFSVGRLDQYAWPLLKADLEAGRTTKAEAQEQLDCLWMKFPETNYINSEYYSYIASGFPSQQQIIVGGQTPAGEEASNPLSYMCIDASIHTLLHQPSISVRFCEATPDSLIEKACELARMGTGHPSFFNDRRCVPALVSKGIQLEDARDYSSVGCASIQPTRKDKGAHNAGYINVAAAMEFALRDGFWKFGGRQMGVHTGDARKFTKFDQVVEAFRRQMAMMIEVYSRAAVRVEKAHQEQVPTPYISAFVQDCIGNARDRSDGGAMINSGMTPRGIGLADVADSLAAIKKLVFDDHALTMSELLDAMDANFEGKEDVRQLLSNKGPKYGNDDPLADEMATKAVDIYCEETDRHRSLFGGRFHPGFSSVSSNVPYGTVIAALPNGRKEYAPLADGCSPSHGVDICGPTAVAISSGKLNHEGMSGGSILNVKFNPATMGGEIGLKRFTNYVRGALEAGVWHMQFNVVDAETLYDAQEHPEGHRDLIVRVAGYSAFFTGLSGQLQEDVIGRTEHAMAAGR
ncbi:MAG: formate C-acetyltransferase/glycerol dehydratase family glycyl radical enzyme [Peptococcaceae bacterium]|jgi:formate C-acetyltransferase|nr:formate C-acetyltransferase/glycerol dehydratase family glycyl radical enzyme [Peptococcaceae bacterium]